MKKIYIIILAGVILAASGILVAFATPNFPTIIEYSFWVMILGLILVLIGVYAISKEISNHTMTSYETQLGE